LTQEIHYSSNLVQEILCNSYVVEDL